MRDYNTTARSKVASVTSIFTNECHGTLAHRARPGLRFGFRLRMLAARPLGDTCRDAALFPNYSGQTCYITLRTQATNTSTTNYANDACDLLPSNMASTTLTIERAIANDVIVALCTALHVLSPGFAPYCPGCRHLCISRRSCVFANCFLSDCASILSSSQTFQQSTNSSEGTQFSCLANSGLCGCNVT